MNPAAPVTRRRIASNPMDARPAVAKVLGSVDLAAMALDLLRVLERVLRVLAVAQVRERSAEVVQRVRLVKLAGAAQKAQRRLRLLRRLLVAAGVQVGGRLVDQRRRAPACRRRARRCGDVVVTVHRRAPLGDTQGANARLRRAFTTATTAREGHPRDERSHEQPGDERPAGRPPSGRRRRARNDLRRQRARGQRVAELGDQLARAPRPRGGILGERKREERVELAARQVAAPLTE